MATASVHRSLFLATIATLLALSTTPALATFRPLKGAAIAGTAAAGAAAGKAGLAAGGLAAGAGAAKLIHGQHATGGLAAGAGAAKLIHGHHATAEQQPSAGKVTIAHPLPLTKQPPSPLVKSICQSYQAKGPIIDDKICLDVLSTVEANAAKDLKGLITVVLKLAGTTATATQAAIKAFLQSPEGKQIPSLQVCQKTLDQVVQSFTKTLPEEMNSNVKTANTNIRTIATNCEECNRAMTTNKVFAPSVAGGIQALTQFSVIGVEITNQMCNEQGKPSLSPSSSPKP